MLVPSTYKTAVVHNGVDVFVCIAHITKFDPLLCLPSSVVYLDFFVAWLTRTCSKEVVEAAIRIYERARAPAKVEVGVFVWRVTPRRFEFVACEAEAG